MAKIEGLVAIVIVCCCEINAGMDYVDYKEHSDEQRLYTAKRRRHRDDIQRSRVPIEGEWEKYLREGTEGPQNIEPILSFDEARFDDLDNTSRKHKNKKKHYVHKYYNSTVRRTDSEINHNKDKKNNESKHRKEEKKLKHVNNPRNITKFSKQSKEPAISHAEGNGNMNKKNQLKNQNKKRKDETFNTLVRDPKLQGQERAKDLKIKTRKPIYKDKSFEKQFLRSTKMMALYQSTESNMRLNQRTSDKEHEYLSAYVIMDQMKKIMENFTDANATYEIIGRTVEYNNIVLVKITEREDKRVFRVKEYKYMDDVPEKKIIFIVHGLSVIGISNMPCLVQSSAFKLLLSFYLKHLDKFDFYIIPIANPDGYMTQFGEVHSDSNKNLSPQSVCSGVFLDRNFDIAWNSSQKISSCSNLFPGDYPFSEVETRAIRDIIHQFGHKILAYIHVHPGTKDSDVFKGDAVLYPRGYTGMQTNDDAYIDIKADIDEAMKNASFRVMSVTVDTLHNWYGTVRGTSVDFAATVYGIPYAMEFVMQPYDSELSEIALIEIWGRIVDNVFNSMWKNLHNSNERQDFDNN